MGERLQVKKAGVLLILVILGSAAHGAQSSACNIYALASCLAYCKSTQVPSRACCSSLATLGDGAVGSECLCSLMNSQVARQYGVIPQFAIGMPNRCGIPVPWHETCNGTSILHPHSCFRGGLAFTIATATVDV